MQSIDGFESLGAVNLNIIEANRIVVGVLEDTPDHVALALGHEGADLYLLMECSPVRARQIAASLMNKADSVEGIS